MPDPDRFKTTKVLVPMLAADDPSPSDVRLDTPLGRMIAHQWRMARLWRRPHLILIRIEMNGEIDDALGQQWTQLLMEADDE